MRLVVTGSLEARTDVGYWLDRWSARYGVPELVVLKHARGVASQALRWALDTVGHERCFVEVLRDYRDDDLREHRRNQRMVDQVLHGDWCVALPCGAPCRDTWDCVTRAWRAGLKVAVCPVGAVNPTMYKPLRLVRHV